MSHDYQLEEEAMTDRSPIAALAKKWRDRINSLFAYGVTTSEDFYECTEQLEAAIAAQVEAERAPRTERRELSELARELDTVAMTLAEKSVRYRHRRTGSAYTLIGVSLRESDLAMLVQYVPSEDKRVVFTRPLLEFQEKFECEGPKP
jgi:hypothetical protein